MQGKSAPIREGDLLLLDVWGKTKDAGQRLLRRHLDRLSRRESAGEIRESFSAFCAKRAIKAVDLIRTSIAAGKPLQGWQVDKAARTIIDKAGYGKYFFHRWVTTSAKPFTVTAPTWITSKHTTSATSSRKRVHRSSRVSTCPSLVCAPK